MSVRGGLKRIFDSLAGKTKPIYYSDRGNRSSVNLDFRSQLNDPHMVRLFSQYRATGLFTGTLLQLTEEDAQFVSQINAGLRVLSETQGQYGVGTMWATFNEKMLESALNADPRMYNHIGALSYKTFKPSNLHLEAVVTQVLKVLVIYDQLRHQTQEFGGLITNLATPYFTLDGHKLNTGIRALEEWLIVKEQVDASQIRRVLEIGGGGGQLANLFLHDGAKMVVIDLPGLHTRAPYFLHKAGHHVCTYDRYLDAGRDVESLLQEYDVIYLPPWEAENLEADFDLALNVHSLGEMSLAEVTRYLELINRTSSFFFSLNTNTHGLDLEKQLGTEENSSLTYPEHLSAMEPIATGTTTADTAFAKILHYAYVIYKRSS